MVSDSLKAPDLRLTRRDRLFGPSTGDWRNNAMTVGTTSASVPYTLGFKEAGDALVEQGLRTRLQDLVFFPALYCYRHAVELALKEIVYLGQRHGGLPKEVIRSHDLLLVWPKARKALEVAWPSGPREDLDAIESIITELAAVDSDGEQFRYDRDRDGHARDLPEQLGRVDLCHLARMMDKLLGNLMGAVDGIDDMLGHME